MIKMDKEKFEKIMILGVWILATFIMIILWISAIDYWKNHGLNFPIDYVGIGIGIFFTIMCPIFFKFLLDEN